jgi:hypothetical protein
MTHGMEEMWKHVMNLIMIQWNFLANIKHYFCVQFFYVWLSFTNFFVLQYCLQSSDVHITMCVYVNKKYWKNYWTKMFVNILLCFSFWLKITLICVLIIQLIIIYTSLMISTNLYFYMDVLGDMGIYLSKKKKPKHIKFFNLSNYLNMMKQL